MGLKKRNYIDRETVITAENLNEIQDAILTLEDGLFSVDNDKSGEVITITDAAKRSFRSLNIFGKTTQNGIPTPDAPVDLVSVGAGGNIIVNVTGQKEAQSMTIATPNGLPGIPVTSGGNYTDANGQQWVCDEIDLARGVYVQRIKVLNLDGTKQWIEYTYQTQYNGFVVDGVLDAPRTRADGLCNQFIIENGNDNCAWLGVNNTAFYVVSKEWYNKGLDAWKNHLNENPLRVLYPRTTPIETPLTAENIAAYAALHTYKDHTTVFNDASAYMELEYVMDAKKYIDSIIGSAGGASAEIHNATVE